MLPPGSRSQTCSREMGECWQGPSWKPQDISAPFLMFSVARENPSQPREPSNGLTGIAGMLGWGMHVPEAGSKGLDVSLGSGLGIS